MQSVVKGELLAEFYIQENCFIAEILNHDSCPEVSVARARVLPGNATELHSLTDTHELYYILSGVGEMEVDGNVVGYVNQGDLIRIPGNITQRIKNMGSEDLIFLCICTPRFETSNYRAL